MSMSALDLGLKKASLLANPKGKELLYHLRLVPQGSHTNVADLDIKEVVDTDDCKIYSNGHLMAVTSTQELERLITLASFNTFEMVEVRTEDNTYLAAVHGDLVKRQYVGVLTDTQGRAVAFVQCIKGTYWANNGTRLIQLEFETDETLVELKAQDCIRYINKNRNQLEGQYDEIVLFK